MLVMRDSARAVPVEVTGSISSDSTEVARTVPDGAMAHELQRWEAASGQQDVFAPSSYAEKSAQLGGPWGVFWDNTTVVR